MLGTLLFSVFTVGLILIPVESYETWTFAHRFFMLKRRTMTFCFVGFFIVVRLCIGEVGTLRWPRPRPSLMLTWSFGWTFGKIVLTIFF